MNTIYFTRFWICVECAQAKQLKRWRFVPSGTELGRCAWCCAPDSRELIALRELECADGRRADCVLSYE